MQQPALIAPHSLLSQPSAWTLCAPRRPCLSPPTPDFPHTPTLLTQHLPKTDIVGHSDPYIVLTVGKGEQAITHRTAVAYNTGSPVWQHEELYLQNVPPGCPLRIEVWDRDRFTADDYVGCNKPELTVEVLKQVWGAASCVEADVGGGRQLSGGEGWWWWGWPSVLRQVRAMAGGGAGVGEGRVMLMGGSQFC